VLSQSIVRTRALMAAAVLVVAALPDGAALAAPAPARVAPKRASVHRAAPSKPQARHPQRKPTVKRTVLLERRVPAVRAGLPNVQALGALVVDDHGHELFSRNADRERPIASISKLAATLAVMDRGLELDGLTTITRGDAEVARRGARSRLLEGMTLSNRDLLHAALMGSDNRAIPALGRAVKLTPTQLAEAMTAKARALGLKKTRFRDPTGLSIENVSTPRETIALLQAVMKNPVLGPITQRLEYDAHPVGRAPIRYYNTHRPAVRPNLQVLGGKTGYNDDARYCLVLAAKIDGQTCYMSFLANEGKLTRFGDVARVADWMVHHKSKNAAPVPVLAAAPPPPGAPAPKLVAAPASKLTAPPPLKLTTPPTLKLTPAPAPMLAEALDETIVAPSYVPTYDVPSGAEPEAASPAPELPPGVTLFARP
jgi:serine-type D-Ala-D-Ala endopeptidase (penicillin-binding protein 7)